MNKHSNFITGFLAASCLFLLISANTKQNPAGETPRYHLTDGGPWASLIVYDAVTGNYRTIPVNEIKKVNGNLGGILTGTEQK